MLVQVRQQHGIFLIVLVIMSVPGLKVVGAVPILLMLNVLTAIFPLAWMFLVMIPICCWLKQEARAIVMVLILRQRPLQQPLQHHSLRLVILQVAFQPIGGVAFTLSATQIAQGTAMAIANGQSFTIATVGNIRAVGTPANAVQLVATDGYSIIIPATSCARTVTGYTPNTTATSQAVALSCSSIPSNAVRTHVVSAGENLFRIGLRYGVHFTTLATYNGIPDATRIFVGQCIAIPPGA